MAIMEERKKGAFKTVADLRIRTGITKSSIEILDATGCFKDLPDADQVSLLD